MAKHKKKVKGPWPIWKLILADVLALGLALVVFALFHHVIPRHEEAVGAVSKRASNALQEVQLATEIPATPQPVATQTPQPKATEEVVVPLATPEATAEPTPEPTATPVPTPDPVGYFGTRFADKFTDGEVIRTENGYQSANVNVTFTQMREFGTEIYIADVYVKDISCLRTVFAKDTFGRGFYERVNQISGRKGGIISITGDLYGGRKNGVVIRNGVLYREDENLKRDVGVLYWDGTLKCFGPKDFDARIEIEQGAYQAWNFGPMLLDKDGNAMTEFNSKVNPANPRSAIGCFEPGHYCLVVVDGRSYQSAGISLQNLSALMESLGCVAAYNLDGGETAAMAAGGELVSKPADGGRACSDFIMVIDEITDDFGEVTME